MNTYSQTLILIVKTPPDSSRRNRWFDDSMLIGCQTLDMSKRLGPIVIRLSIWIAADAAVCSGASWLSMEASSP